MEITTYSNFRLNLKSFLDLVISSRFPLFVTRSNGEDVVVMSKTEYESIQETLHLLSSPKNAQRLAKGIAEFEQGQGVVRDPIRPGIGKHSEQYDRAANRKSLSYRFYPGGEPHV